MLTNFHCRHLQFIYITLHLLFHVPWYLLHYDIACKKFLYYNIHNVTSQILLKCFYIIDTKLGSLNIICNIYFYQWIIFADNTYLYDSGLMT